MGLPALKQQKTVSAAHSFRDSSVELPGPRCFGTVMELNIMGRSTQWGRAAQTIVAGKGKKDREKPEDPVSPA